MRAVFNNGLSLALYKPLLRLVTGRDIHDRRPFHSELRHKLTAAFLTGGLSQLIANPVDIIKVPCLTRLLVGSADLYCCCPPGSTASGKPAKQTAIQVNRGGMPGKMAVRLVTRSYR